MVSQVSRKKHSYSVNEEGTVQKTTTDEGYSYESQYPNEPKKKFLTNQWRKIDMDVDLGEGQFFKTFNIEGSSEPEQFQIGFKSKTSGNLICVEKMNDQVIFQEEKDKNGNTIRRQRFEKVDDEFIEYDDNNNLAASETWKIELWEENFANAKLENTEYDSNNRPVFVETTYYGKEDHNQWYEDNDNQYLKNKYYLNNR